jgi:hypothetical protein
MVMKGVGAMAKRSEEAQKAAQKERILYVKIEDGESAMLRFVTESDEIISADFHSYKEMTPDGERTRTKYCPRDRACQKCAEGNATKELIFIWAWVYYILHLAQNPALDKNPAAIKWERVMVGTKGYYKEIINEFRVFRTGIGKDNKYRSALISFAQDYGTFLDRDYRFTRTGKELKTNYELVPQNPKPMDEKIKGAISYLPPLEKIVTGEVYNWPKEETAESEDLPVEPPPAKPVAAAPAPATIKKTIGKPVPEPVVTDDEEPPVDGEEENIF